MSASSPTVPETDPVASGRPFGAVDVTWLALLGLTLLTWIVGDDAALGLGRSALLLMGLATLKAVLIAAVFMELARRGRMLLLGLGAYLVVLWLVLWLILARG
ncbi:MAG TPA: hypothetical protein ENI86_16395 [Acidimicrobiales bacterium]|nr:hypothetical protein [Acidimicrobiales bacterium]